ncbi:MAG: ABC-type transport auxiliary lipoprotein family protein [Victivallaceae bacterium]
MKRLLLGLSAVFLAGCSIFPKPDTTAVNFFDIQPAQNITSQGSVPQIMVLTFQSESTYGSRMVFKTNDHQVKFDEFNRWAAPPDEMVRNLLTAYLSGSKEQTGPPSLSIEGDVLKFYCDLPNKNVNITIAVTVREYPSQKIAWCEVFSRSVKIEQETAGDFASAASKGIVEIAEAIKNRLASAKP